LQFRSLGFIANTQRERISTTNSSLLGHTTFMHFFCIANTKSFVWSNLFLNRVLDICSSILALSLKNRQYMHNGCLYLPLLDISGQRISLTQSHIEIACCITKFKENSDKSRRKAYEGEPFCDFSSLVPPSSTYGQNINSKELIQLVGFLRQGRKLNSTRNHLPTYERIISVIRYILLDFRCLTTSLFYTCFSRFVVLNGVPGSFYVVCWVELIV